VQDACASETNNHVTTCCIKPFITSTLLNRVYYVIPESVLKRGGCFNICWQVIPKFTALKFNGPLIRVRT